MSPTRTGTRGRAPCGWPWASGCWDAANGKYLLPQATADATHPGGAGTATNPAAFFNVAFRTAEPQPSVTAETGAVTNAAWWRDQQQGTALAAGDISPLFANVNFAKLAARVTDNSQIPVSGPMDRILASHFEPAQGANYSGECGLQGAEDPSTCVPEYQGNLQPYAVYVPAGRRPRRRLRDDPAAALAVGQLQPVLRQP